MRVHDKSEMVALLGARDRFSLCEFELDPTWAYQIQILFDQPPHSPRLLCIKSQIRIYIYNMYTRFIQDTFLVHCDLFCTMVVETQTSHVSQRCENLRCPLFASVQAWFHMRWIVCYKICPAALPWDWTGFLRTCWFELVLGPSSSWIVEICFMFAALVA